MSVPDLSPAEPPPDSGFAIERRGPGAPTLAPVPLDAARSAAQPRLAARRSSNVSRPGRASTASLPRSAIGIHPERAAPGRRGEPSASRKVTGRPSAWSSASSARFSTAVAPRVLARQRPRRLKRHLTGSGAGDRGDRGLDQAIRRGAHPGRLGPRTRAPARAAVADRPLPQGTGPASTPSSTTRVAGGGGRVRPGCNPAGPGIAATSRRAPGP